MKPCARVVLVMLVMALGLGCHGDPPPAPPYARDIEKLCNVSVLSGADPQSPNGRTLTIATWLAANLETSEAHDFLIRIQPLEGEAKAQALLDEAHKVGQADCALAGEWRK
jgi:hypothetical protein